MSIDSETLQTIANFTNSLLGRFESRITNRIKAAFTNSDTDIPSSKLVKNEFAQVRSEIPTKTSDLTNDGAVANNGDVFAHVSNIPTKTSDLTNDGNGSQVFVLNNDSRLSDTRNPKAHNQASSTITDTNTYSALGNTAQNQQSINQAINNKIQALLDLDLIEMPATRPTASANTENKLYLLPDDDPESEDMYAIYITVKDGNTYKWERIDSPKINLTTYVQFSDVVNAVTSGETKPVQSGAVYTAIENKATALTNTMDSKVSAHNTDANAHSSKFSAVNTKITNDIATHNNSLNSHSALIGNINDYLDSSLDSIATSAIVDAVTNGDQRAVTSNAVYDYVNSVLGSIEQDMLS